MKIQFINITLEILALATMRAVWLRAGENLRRFLLKGGDDERQIPNGI